MELLFVPNHTYLFWHGIATVIGGMFYGWNAALTSGFGSYLIAQVLIGIADIILILALCEMVSSAAFSGGSFGMGRVVLGFYAGFIVAEALEYTFFFILLFFI
jgi:hypothetical protein